MSGFKCSTNEFQNAPTNRDDMLLLLRIEQTGRIIAPSSLVSLMSAPCELVESAIISI